MHVIPLLECFATVQVAFVAALKSDPWSDIGSYCKRRLKEAERRLEKYRKASKP